MVCQKGGLGCKGCKEEIYSSDTDTKPCFCIILGIQGLSVWSIRTINYTYLCGQSKLMLFSHLAGD